ncbi:MAG TPA: Hpt domain-containing protein [Xanthobacteraceae bacterium]
MPTCDGEKVAIETFADYQIIRPPNTLREKVRVTADDPVARAEAAVAELSPHFASWMDAECDCLDAARASAHASGLTKSTAAALLHAAHDIKGDAATFGFPLIAEMADGLCRLIESAREPSQIPLALIDQHVDAVRAIKREQSGEEASRIASRLREELDRASAEFLGAHESAAAQETASPPIVP